MFMYSHLQLCIAMHGGGRLGCMVMYAQVRPSSTSMHSHVQLCTAMHGGRRLGCMVIGPSIYSCTQSFILIT